MRSLDDCWERLGDALFTYCLSVLCDQDEAVAAVREVRQLSVRHRRRLRRPEQARAWLYALARHVCLLRMEAGPVPADTRGMTGRHDSQHSRLAKLSWPEAAGIAPLQREVLELVGRHGLASAELGDVLDLRADEAGVLTAQAVCELERTAAVLAVLAAEGCPELTQLGVRRGAVLGTALRGELVRHVDACPTCRGTAERASAAGPWPGTLRTPEALVLVEAPPGTWRGAGGEGLLAALSRGRSRRDGCRVGGQSTGSGDGVDGVGDAAAACSTSAAAPSAAQEIRFDRRGFPVHRTARSERAALLRQRAMASSVIALVVAAPVVALWVAHHGQGPGQGPEEAPVSSVQVDTSPVGGGPQGRLPRGGRQGPGPGPSRSVVATTGETTALVALGVAQTGAAAPGRLTVAAGELGGRTVVTLANPGGAVVAWQATTTAAWLRLSRASGTLQPGEQFTLLVTVDEAATPEGPWSAQLAIEPSASVVTLQGPGTGGRRGLPPPTASGSPSAGPSPAPSTSATASAGPSSGPPSGPSTSPSAHPTTSSPSGSPSASPTRAAPSGTPTASGSPSAAPSSGHPSPSVPPSGRHRAPAS